MDIKDTAMPTGEQFVTERVDLPSGGFLYSGDLASGYLTMSFKPFATRSKLAAVKSLKDFCKVLQTCLTQNIDLQNLLPADFMYIVYKFRAIQYGAEYTAVTECENNRCQQSVSVEVNLDTILDNAVFLTEAPKLEAEISGKTVGYKWLTIGEDELCQEEAKKSMRKFGITYKEALYKERNLASLVSIDGVQIRKQERELFFNSITDARELIKWERLLSAQNFGMNTETEFTCQYCDKIFWENLPISEEFFSPKI